MSSKVKFKVVHTTSEDPDFPSAQLNIHKHDTKGWQSERLCKYPQELVLKLERESEIKHIQILSHQSKIARRIEIFVGKPAPGGGFETVAWKKLGYLSMNDNKRSEWKARELKSVYIDCQGSYLKFLLHQSHINNLNLYNQVGIVALNVLGTQIEKNSVDDLTFDLEFDEITAAQIREYTQAKRKAVDVEDYDEAKRLKFAIEHLQKMGTTLSQMEREKKKAVAREDYDAAKRLKTEIQQIRNQMQGGAPAQQRTTQQGAYQAGLPTSWDPQQAPPGAGQPALPGQIPSAAPRGYAQQQHAQQYQGGYPGQYGQGGYHPNAISPPAAGRHRQPAPPQHHPHHGRQPERGVSAGAAPTSARGLSVGYQPSPGMPSSRSRHLSVHQSPYANQVDERKALHEEEPYDRYHDDDEGLPAPPRDHDHIDRHKPPSRQIRPKPNAGFDDTIRATGNQDEENPFGDKQPELPDENKKPKALTAHQQKALENHISSFGDSLVAYLVSKAWHHRRAGVKKLQEKWGNGHFKRNEKTAFRSSAEVAAQCLKDRVAAVQLSGVDLVFDLINRYSGCVKADGCQKLMHPICDLLVKHLASSNARVASSSKACLELLGQHPKVGPQKVFTAILRGPSSKGRRRQVVEPAKPLERKGEILVKLLENKLPKGVAVNDVMALVCKMLKHKDGKVREVGVDLTTDIYGEHGQKIVGELDSLNDFMKETLNQAILERYGQANVLERQEPSQKFQNRPSKAIAGSNPPPKKKKKKAKKKAKARNNPPPPEPQMPPEEAKDDEFDEVTDRCNFCGLQDPSFAEDEKNLDFHFWKCPMLVECTYCAQLIDIPSLWEHLLTECEEAEEHQACPRCECPIPVSLMEEHLHQEVPCRVAKPKDQANRCPLCLEDIPPGEEGWNRHILEDTCPKNPQNAHVQEVYDQ